MYQHSGLAAVVKPPLHPLLLTPLHILLFHPVCVSCFVWLTVDLLEVLMLCCWPPWGVQEGQGSCHNGPGFKHLPSQGRSGPARSHSCRSEVRPAGWSGAHTQTHRKFHTHIHQLLIFHSHFHQNTHTLLWQP